MIITVLRLIQETFRLMKYISYKFSSVAQQQPGDRRNKLPHAVLSSSILLITTLFITTSVQAQQPSPTPTPTPALINVTDTPPQRAAAESIVVVCSNLVNNFPQAGGATGDLRERCREMVQNANQGNDLDGVRSALQEVSVDKIASEGTTAIDILNSIIGARITALRLGVAGIGIGGLALNLNNETFPGTYAAGQEQALNTNGQAISDARVAGPLSFAISNQVPEDEASPFSKFGAFLNGEFSFGDKDATSREAGFDFDTLGVTGGVDYRFTDNFFLGAALSFSSTDVDLDSSGGNLDANAYSGSIYGSYYVLDRIYIDGIATFGWIDYDFDRNISYSIADIGPIGDNTPTGGITTVNQTARGDTDATLFSFSIGAGYDFSIGAFTFGPLARVDYARLDIDGYQEEIDGPCDTDINPGCGLALDVDSQDVDSLTTALGGQVSYALSTQLGVLLPQLRFEWVHEFKNDDRTLSAFFVEDPIQNESTEIRLRTDDPDRNFFNLGGGISATFPYGISAFVYYETVLGFRDIEAHEFVVGARIEL